MVPLGWRDLVLHETKKRKVRVNRISYEICAYQSFREKLRCKEIWVEGADRFRNPDDDLPSDFDVRRTTYYEALKQPLNSETFIANLQQDMRNALAMLDKGLPRNSAKRCRLCRHLFKILTKDNKGQISLSPLAPQPEPVNLARLKAELMRRWPMTSLLDMLKETDLRSDARESSSADVAKTASSWSIWLGDQHRIQADCRRRLGRKI